MDKKKEVENDIASAEDAIRRLVSVEDDLLSEGITVLHRQDHIEEAIKVLKVFVYNREKALRKNKEK